MLGSPPLPILSHLPSPIPSSPHPLIPSSPHPIAPPSFPYSLLLATNQTMSLVDLAVVGKDGRPLYLREFRPTNEVDDEIDQSAAEDDIFTLAHEAMGTAGACSLTPLKGGILSRCSLSRQFILHSALDRMDHLTAPEGFGTTAWRRPGAQGPTAMYVGLLGVPAGAGAGAGANSPVRVYGYITTTKIKILAVVKDDCPTLEAEEVMEGQLIHLMSNVHRLYTEYIANPFTEVGAKVIESKTFDSRVLNFVNSFNGTS